MTHPEPPLAGDETATLLGSLERVRSYVEWKCGGLDAAGLQAKIGASSITLGGLLKHLALVEDDYFTSRLFGRELGTPVEHGGLGRRPATGSGTRPPRTRLSSS